MLSYKLIKKYPLSMDVGTIVKEVTGGYMSDNLIFFHKEYIENYPEFWEEIKEPLFITEDGIKVFHGDRLWLVNANYEYYSFYSDCQNVGKRIFSTEKAAKDWINLNKPMYSKKQIMDAALVKYVTGTILLHIKDIK